MKKIAFILAIISLLAAINVNAFAATNIDIQNTTSEIKYFADGSYIESVLILEESTVSTYATNANTGTRKLTYKNSAGETQWTATLTATFTYTGSSSTCTKSSISYSISNNNWKITSATASKSGNKATGNVTAKYYVLGIPTKTIGETITMTCSSSGIIS